jgi:diguanylate cyclase (GGDEF)-like protein
MKITDPSKSGPLGRVRSAAAAPRPEAASTPAPAEAAYFRGVPDTELTPRVREALISLIEEVTALRKELTETQARMRDLEQLAETDPLLGVANRRAFVRDLNRALALVERYGTPASLIFADLDNLKVINDSLGHPAGDAALAHVGAIIAANIRLTDTFGRLGGDEFGVILLQADQNAASEKAQALSEAISSTPVEWRDHAFTAEISYGVVEIRKGWSVDEALETADSAMYEAKRNGRP